MGMKPYLFGAMAAALCVLCVQWRTRAGRSLKMTAARSRATTRGLRAFHRAPTSIRSRNLNKLSTFAHGGATAVMSGPKKVDSLESAKELLDGIDTIIFDCDGVIWLGDTIIEGIPETLDYLRGLGKTVYFVTNNARKSRKGYKKKFDDLGLEISPEEVLSSSFAAAAYLDKIDFQSTGKSVYVIGDVGIGEELDLMGIKWFGGPQDWGREIELKSGYALPFDENVGAVVVGFDYGINYYKIQYAQLCINENPGCLFIATNLDARTHLTDAQEWAGNGAMAGAIKGCTGQDPIVVGKPSPLLIDYLVQKYGLQKDRILMVGDRLDTDIVFGNDNGLKSCLTLTGVTPEKKLLSPENKIIPNVYVDSINAFRGA